MALLKLIGRAFVGFCSGINAFASFCIFLILVFVCTDVAGRVFFNSPIMGTSEIVKVGVVMMAFMQIPWAFWENRHLRSELITGRLGPMGQLIASFFRHIIAIAAGLLISVANWKPMLHAWRIREYEGEGALEVPVYPLYTLIQLGSALVVIISFYYLIRTIQEMFGRKAED